MATILEGTEKNIQILLSNKELHDQLLVIERAGRTCYQSIKGPITYETAEKFCKMLLKRGHLSVLEHSHVPVKLVNPSRGVTHELVRHRVAMAFSQESTHFVDESDVTFIIPPNINPDQEVPLDETGNHAMTARELVELIEAFYRGLISEKIQPRYARQFLPIGLKAEIIASTNFRQWRHIFMMRTQKAAHWEIRSCMGNLLRQLQNAVPVVFDDFEEIGVDNLGVPYYTCEYGSVGMLVNKESK